MKNKDEDQDWLDALAGKAKTDADPKVVKRANTIRQAIQRHDTTLQESEFDVEAGLQKLKFRLRHEGLIGVEHRSTLNKRIVQYAVAASIILTVGLMMRPYFYQEPMQNEAEIMRGLGNMQIVLAADPEARLRKITTELDRLNIKYQIERNEAQVILKIQGVNPEKEDVSSFLERNHIKPPVGTDVILDIRPMTKP